MLGTGVIPSLANGRLQFRSTGSPLYLDVPRDAALQQAGAWTVQPQNPYYAAGQPLRLSLTYRNPDAVPHRVRFLVMDTPDGARTPVPTGEDIVGPQQTLAIGVASPRWRGSGARPRRRGRGRVTPALPAGRALHARPIP